MLYDGGNDLGVRSMRELIQDVKIEFLQLHSTFPDMSIVGSDIVGRTSWRLSQRLNKALFKLRCL